MTPDDFEKLRHGLVSANHIWVNPSAHPDPLSLPIHFANSKYMLLTFADAYKNEIQIAPFRKEAIAFFHAKTDLLAGIPVDYTDYIITFSEPAVASNTDIDRILEWKNATNLRVLDAGDAAYRLLQRVDELAEMKQLQWFLCNINQQTYKKINVGLLLDQVKSVEYASFTGKELSVSELKGFSAAQAVSRRWKTKIQGQSVVFSKY